MKVYDNFDLTDYNSYKIKSKCSKAYFPENESDILFFLKNEKDYIILGNGNNIILSKENYILPFLILNNVFDSITKEDQILEIDAGADMLKVSEFALENELSGLEMFYDIPSSLGGAIVMNAGANGEEIKDLIIKVRYLDLVDLKIKEKTKDELNFNYRNSFFQINKDKIILKAWIQLKSKSKKSIESKMNDIKQKRWLKQPKEFPNAGSVFKRPKNLYVGPMIDELGLKGLTIGGAQISEKHSGFIINIGNASGKDILELIKIVQSKVSEKFNIDLEIEQIII
jgi:UDP-N-acetylmuramate dehydrogenase